MKKMLKIECPENTVYLVANGNENELTELIRQANPSAVITQFEPGEMKIADYPEDVQAEIRDILTEYNSVTVEFEHNEFTAFCGTILSAAHYYDYFPCGTVKSSDI